MSGYSFQAFCPYTKVLIPVLLPDAVVGRVMKGSSGWKYYELVGDKGQHSSVASVLAAPELIFKGNKRETHIDGFCYSGVPRYRYSNEGSMLPPPPGMVFVVFLNAMKEIHDWAWMPKDEFDGRANVPHQAEDRFVEHIWPEHLKIF